MSKACPERLILNCFHPIAASHLHKAVLPAQHWSSDASARHISKPWSPAKQPLRPSLVLSPCRLSCEIPFAKTLLLNPISCTTLNCTSFCFPGGSFHVVDPLFVGLFAASHHPTEHLSPRAREFSLAVDGHSPSNATVQRTSSNNRFK